MHSLLTRQLRRHFGTSAAVPPELAAFLESVDEAYRGFDADRHMLEHSLDLSSMELHEANSALQGVLQALPDIFFRIDEAGTILECRGGSEETLLCPRHRLVGRRIQSVPDAEAGAVIEAGIRMSLETDALATVEYTLAIGSSQRGFEARIVPVLDRQLVVVVRDVTDRKRAEDERARQQTFLRHVVDLDPSFIFVKDEQGRFTFANEAVANAYGKTVDEVLGKTEADLGRSLDEVEVIRRHEEDVLQIGRDSNAPEERFTTPRGHVRRVRTTRRAIAAPDGRGRQVLAITTDITDLLRAQSDLRERTERLFAHHNALHDLVITEEGDGEGQLKRILAVSARMLEVARVSVWDIDDRDALVLRDLYDRGALRDGGGVVLERSRYPRLFASATVSRTIAAVDARLDMRTSELTGDYLVPRGITSLLVGPICVNGKLVGLVCHEGGDRARRWTAEEEQFAASIADVVALTLAGRKRRLLEQQLLQSQKMEAIGSLAAGVAHDFNNLLSAISGFADLTLKRLEPDALARKSAEQIIKATHRGAWLTRQLLTFSRKQVLPPQILDLNAIVRDMEPMLRRLIGESIAINVDLGRHIGHVRGDAGQLEQILLNLVVNARDAMSAGGAMWIETHNAADVTEHLGRPAANEGKRSVVLSVRDSGVGMSPETQARIFEPFYTTKAKGQGSGLGLSTVYGIVRQMGGEIRVQSERGHGSTFWIHFPQVDAPPEPAQSVPVAESPSLRGSESILVVEDDQQLLTVAVETLQHYGYQVMGAATGMEALLLSEQSDARIDLMVVDIVMPHIDGPDFVQCARQLRSDVKVLFMSGLNRGVPEHLAGDRGNVAFIQKPFMPDDLVAEIRRLLDHTRPSAPEGISPRLEDSHGP